MFFWVWESTRQTCYKPCMRNQTLAAQDAVTLAVPGSVEKTVENLKRYWQPGAASVSYRPSRRLAGVAHANEFDLPYLKRLVVQQCPDSWRSPNVAVLEAVYDLGVGRKVIARPAPRNWVLPVRADLGLRINLDWLAVVDGDRGLYWLQCRKTYTQTDAQLGLLARIFLRKAEEDDLADYGLNIVDMRFGDKETRTPRLRTLGDLPVATLDEAEAVVQVLADAIDQIRREGWVPPRPPRKKDDGQRDFFGDG